MRSTSLIILFVFYLLINTVVIGQNKVTSIPTDQGKDTSFIYKGERELDVKLGLQNLTKSTDSIHLRFSRGHQIVDIWTLDGIRYKGNLYVYISGQSSRDKKRNKPLKFYSKVKPIDTALAGKIARLYFSLQINKIPEQDSIKGWASTFDGYTFDVEYSTPKTYSLKYYINPEYSRNLKEGLAIDSLSTILYEKLNMEQNFQDLTNGLPQGMYRNGMAIISISSRFNHAQRFSSMSIRKKSIFFKWHIHSWKKTYYINVPKLNYSNCEYWSGTAKSLAIFYNDSSSIHVMIDPASWDALDRKSIYAFSVIKQETKVKYDINNTLTDTVKNGDTTIFTGKLTNGNAWKEKWNGRVKICYVNVKPSQVQVFDSAINSFRNKRRNRK